MPAVRGLEDYLRTLEIVEPRPLHELQDTIIGVDVFQWLRSNNFIVKEALHSALGGLPITLEQQVHDQLSLFHKWKIQPLFVFNGLKYSQNARAPFSSSRSRKYAAKRKQAWKSMENENINKAIDLFSQISGYVSISAQDDLIRIFSRWNAMIPQRNKSLHANYLRNKEKEKEENKDNNGDKIEEPNYFKAISWFRAPYYAASQMAYLESHEEMLHAVCGGCDLLMFGGEKVILNIDFETSSYEITDLDKVLYSLKVNTNPYCFIDTCLLSGFDASRTFEPLTLTNLYSLTMNNHKSKKGSSRRNFSYEYSLEKVLKKGSGIEVINEYLCTFNDAGSTSSYNSNYSASTYTSIQSTRSMRSIGGKSTRSMKSTRSAMSVRGYQQKTKQSARNAGGKIDKILQHMLTASNENNEINTNNMSMLTENNLNNIAEDDEKMENPKYREYLELYLVVRERVCNAKVLSFNGETKIYRPFKWMNEQLLKIKKQQLKQQQNEEEKKKEDEEERKKQEDMNKKPDENIPSNVYRLLGVGILSTFLPSAILGGHLIDTTPLIDSMELENSMNNLLPLRQKILDIFQNAFGTNNSISLQRWFQPNRDKQINYNYQWSLKWVKQFKYCLNILFNDKCNKIDSKRSIAFVTPLKMINDIKQKTLLNPLNITDYDELQIPEIKHISQLLVAAYCGTLITLNHIRDNCTLSNIALSLSKINKFEFETVLAIEMLQNEDLSEKIFNIIDENGKNYTIDNLSSAKYKNIDINQALISKRRTLRLLTRICSLLPMRPFIDGKKPWISKLSHSLAAFNHVTTTYHHGIKNCIESAITWLYCHIDNKSSNGIILTSPTFLKELALSLKQLPPEPCTGMGVLIQEFVINFNMLNWNQISDKIDDQQKITILKKQLDELKNTFPVFTRIHFAIQCCMQFFYQICTLVKELGDVQVLNQNVIIQFEDAYEYLRELGIWDAIYFMEINQINQNKKTSTKTSK